MACWIFFISATPAAQNSPELNIPFLVSNDLLYYISDVSQQAFVLIKNCTKISLKRNSKLSLDQEPLQLHTTLSSSWRLFSKNPIMLVEPTILARHKKCGHNIILPILSGEGGSVEERLYEKKPFTLQQI